MQLLDGGSRVGLGDTIPSFDSPAISVNLEQGMEHKEKGIPIGADLSVITYHIC